MIERLNGLRATPIIAGLWVVLSVVSIVATVAAQPEWWTWIAPEASLAREINTVLLLATSGLAALVWWRDRKATPVMGLLVLGFGVLAVDERLAGHERLRDRYLVPRDITLPFVPWAEPGDIVLVVVALVGLALAAPVLRVMAVDRRALRWFGAAIVLAAVAVALDTLPIETFTLANEIRFQSGEEALELVSAGCFVSALLCLLEARSPSGASTVTGSAAARDVVSLP